jgi:glutaredoxin
MNKKRIILSSLVFAIFFAIVLYLVLTGKSQGGKVEVSQSSKDELVLYYGNGCPHCALVEDFIQKNNVLSKINLKEKEVYYNQKNAEELAEKAKICGMDTNAIGVPFLWDGKKCIVGDSPVIDFLKSKLSS